MALSGRAKVVRVLSILVVSSLLVVVGIIKAMNLNKGNSNSVIGSVMLVLVVILICCVLEMCWLPFGRSSDSSGSSIHGTTTDTASINTMDIPLVYTEAPPAYDEVVRSQVQESELTWSPSTGIGSTGLGRPVESASLPNRVQNSPKPAGGELFADTSDTADGKPSPLTSRNPRIGANEDDFEEVYIPRRFSPFFSEGSPMPSSYSNSSEVQLSVDCLPTYDEAVTVLQAQSRRSTGSRSSQDENLILFM